MAVPLLALCLAVAGLLAALALAGPARAAEEPFTLEFDQSRVDAGFLGGLGLDVDGLSGPSSIEGTIDDDGRVKIPKDGFELPRIDVSTIAGSLTGFDLPVDIEGYMGIEQAATGNFDRSTGELEIDAKAGIWISLNPQQLLGALGGLGGALPPELSAITGLLGNNLTCGFSPMDVTFTTESTSLGTGQRFSKGLQGPGALTGEWSRLGPFAGKTRILVFDVCSLIRSQLPGLLSGLVGDIGGGVLGNIDLSSLLSGLDELDLGPSALTIRRTLDESPPTGKARLKMKVSPGRAKAKNGRPAIFRVKVKNVGTASASAVKVCRKAPEKAVKGTACRKLGTIPAGKAKKGSFKLRMTRKAKRSKYGVRFKVSSSDGTSGNRRAWLARSRR